MGLLEIRAWNMLHSAPMDTPARGVVTHQNCLAVLGLRQAIDLAGQTGGAKYAKRWATLADNLTLAINKHLWDKNKNAYIDSIHNDGIRSAVFSQQTHTAAYISGVAKGQRAKRSRAIMENAPRGFVTAGSPFFMFFVLEGLVRESRYDELIGTIRDYWGKQIEAGATTFWEQYHDDKPRMTRSHCHGWSAAPTFFLSQHVLGVQPAKPGYAKVKIAPQIGKLKWARGRVPTPRGDIECSWTRSKKEFTIAITLPPKTPAEIEFPFSGKLTIEQGKAKRLPTRKGKTRLEVSGGILKATLASK